MRRGARDNSVKRYPKPVTKVELEEKNVKLRIILIIIFVIIAGVCIGIGVSSYFGTDAGWTIIEVDYDENNNASEFVFAYELGTTDVSPSTEKKMVSNIYTNAIIKAYQLFDEQVEYIDVNNIYYINHHPNEEIKIDTVLYNCFETLNKYHNRIIYFEEIFAQYCNLFTAETDFQASVFDPLNNEELKNYFLDVIKYVNDEAHIQLLLLGNNTIKLYVSDEYLNYMNENDLSTYLNLQYLKNAFIIDYICSELINAGYTAGYITSYDGYTRNIDTRNNEYQYNIKNLHDNYIITAASFNYTSNQSIIYLRNYSSNDTDGYLYYEYQDGTRKTRYFDVYDGIDKAVTSNMIALSKDKTCSELLLEILPVYINESIDLEQIAVLKNNNINTIYMENKTIYYNGSLTFKNIYQNYGVRNVEE